MTKKIKTKLNKSKLALKKMPVVSRREKPITDLADFPLDHYSYSSLVQFSVNPILFKIKYVNKDQYDTTSGTSGVIGKAFHEAMEMFYSVDPKKDEALAIEIGLKAGMDSLEKYPDGFIKFSDTVPNKQRMYELFAQTYNFYIMERKDEKEKILDVEQEISEFIDINWKGKQLNLPVKLKGFPDQIIMTKDKKLKIKDYKTCRSFSNPEKIGGSKIIQAIQYYLLAYAKYGIEPYSMIYEEIKVTKNADGGKQVRSYEIVYAENELYFDFYFRLYEDVTNALNGKMVYVPNVYTLFDNEVAIISYIHRLDMTEEKAKQMKKLKVDNITDLLKKKIQKAGNMRKFMKTIEKQFISAKNLNYNRMETHEKIQTKLMEHGLMLQFDSVIEGASVNLYRYTPSIGLKMSRLNAFVADIEQVVGKSGIRVLAPISNTSLVGFEIPKDERTFPKLPASKGFNLAIGETIMGEVKNFDIRTAPHMLVAGSTGSGKSIFLHSIIKQLIKLPNVELHIFDPKQVEMFKYEESVEEYKHNHVSIAESLQNLVREMENRYDKLRKAGVRSISEMPRMKYKFIVIDEYADLALKSEMNVNIQLLAQKGRSCGIHLIIATQRASTKIIDGDVKINFPVKIVFRMSKEVDSRVMLDQIGAEKLLGKGDCLFATESGIERLQAFNVK